MDSSTVIKNSIGVCIITYKRPKSIVNTIKTILKQKLPENFSSTTICPLCNDIKESGIKNVSYDIIVIDNDPNQSSKDVIDDFNKKNINQIIYLYEPRRGIPFARNKAVEYCTSRYQFLAFTDDDDEVDSNWLKELLSCYYNFKADVVQGAIVCKFSKPIPSWVDGEENPFVIYNRKRFLTGAELTACSTGNVLINTNIFKEYSEPFNIEFSKTGGSDTHFFRQLYGKYKMIFSDEAIVYENVPPSRQTYKWNFMRIFRNGNASALILRVNNENRELRKNVLRWMIIKLPFKIILFPILIPFYKLIPTKKIIRHICRIYYGFGFIAGSFGYKYNEYKTIHGE